MTDDIRDESLFIDEPAHIGFRRQPLLGALAARAGLGETFATEALTVLLQSPRLRATLMCHLERRLGIGLSDVRHLLAETDHAAFGRTDIEGQDAAGRPLLIVEAKLGAALTSDQIARYLALQSEKCGSLQSGLVLLMPKSKAEDAEQLLRRAVRASGTNTSTACVTWHEVLGVLQEALEDGDRGSNSIEADLVQLRALVDARTRFVLPPLGVAATGAEWQSRRAELVGLVDVATQRIADALGVPRGPQVGRRDIAFAPSYYLRASGPVEGTHFSVGLHRGFAAEGLTPLWVRFNKTTAGGRAIELLRQFLGDSPRFGHVLRRDGGALWIPIDLDPRLADEELVDDVVAQIRDALAAAHAEPSDLNV